jgi:hypothetical protein
LDDVLGVECARLDLAVRSGSLDGSGPLACSIVPRTREELRLHPNIELERLCVGFEPLGELVLWGEDGPVIREWDVGHVVIPDRVVKDQLMVSLAPIISDSIVAVDNKGRDAEHLEAGVGC